MIDRFEGDYAVVQYRGKMLNLPRVFFPSDTREGALIDVIVLVDDRRTEDLINKAEEAMVGVWED